MPKKRLVASLAVAAGLGLGGLAGLVLGVPSVSAAQTTTTVPSTEDPTTPVPPDSTTPPADRPERGENCPDKDGESGGSSGGASADAAFRGGPGTQGGGVVQSL